MVADKTDMSERWDPPKEVEKEHTTGIISS